MAQTNVTVKLKLAWWFPILVRVLAPFGWLGLRMPDRLTGWIAEKATKAELA